MSPGRDSFRRNRVAPVATVFILALWTVKFLGPPIVSLTAPLLRLSPRDPGQRSGRAARFVSSSLKLRVLRLRVVLGTFLPLLFLLFFRWRVTLEALCDFLVHFFPDFIDVQNFLLQKQTPGEIFSFYVDKVDHQRAFPCRCRVPQLIGIGPVIDDDRIKPSPV